MIESLISNKQKPNPYNMTCTFIPITNLVPRKRQTKRDTSINNNTTNQIIEHERVPGQKINISQRNTIIHLIYIYKCERSGAERSPFLIRRLHGRDSNYTNCRVKLWPLKTDESEAFASILV